MSATDKELETNRLVFVVAMAKEAAPLAGHLERVTEKVVWGRRVVEGEFKGIPVAAIISGIGKVNAAAATQLALSLYAPKRILNLGVAGGLKPNMKIGEIYPVARAVEYDFDLTEVNGTSPGVLDEFTTPYLELSVAPKDIPRAVTLVSGDHFTNDAAEHVFLARFQAGLRDMESAAIAHVCATAGVECRAWKCVSDVAGAPEMTRQYKENLALCLDKLAEAIPSLAF